MTPEEELMHVINRNILRRKNLQISLVQLYEIDGFNEEILKKMVKMGWLIPSDTEYTVPNILDAIERVKIYNHYLKELQK